MSKKGLLETVKADAVDGSYRAAGRKSLNLAQTAIVKAFQKGGVTDAGKLGALKEFFKTDIGNIGLGIALGQGIQHIPTVGDDPRVKRLTKEWRVDSYAKGQGMLVDTLLSVVGPGIGSILDSLPSAEKEEARELQRAAEKPTEVPAEMIPVEKTKAQ